MTNITIKYKDEKITLPVNKRGNLLFKSLKKIFPEAKGLVYEDESGRVHTLTALSGKILINSDVKEYDLCVNDGKFIININLFLQVFKTFFPTNYR